MQTENTAYTGTYLDNNATSLIAPEVMDAILSVYRLQCGNPSSAHHYGQASSLLLQEARTNVASLLGAHASEIVFTSGGSESNNTAILSAIASQSERNEIIVSAIEHASVLNLCTYLENTGKVKVHRIPVNADGRVEFDAYREALSYRTVIVAIQWANNETGVLQPVEELSALAQEFGALFHCDAVQAAGKIQLNVATTAINTLAVSAHKMHGPQGVGALYVRRGTPFTPLVFGGRQERGRRAGSENVAGIVGFGSAAQLANQWMREGIPTLSAMRDQLESCILAEVSGAMILSRGAQRLSNTSCIAFPGIEGDEIVTLLDQLHVAASSGAACATGAMEPSHVVRAMKVPRTHVRGVVRFSFSRMNVEMDVACAVRAVVSAYKQLQACIQHEEPMYG